MHEVLAFILVITFSAGSTSAEIVEMNYKGLLIGDTTIPGEQKSDWIAPSQPFCMRLSKDRWFIIFVTRAFAGFDDDRSILYQIRSGAPDGPVIREGILRKGTAREWNRLGTGETIWKQHGPPIAFGVPKGAVKDGHLLPNNNVFVASWAAYDRLEEDGKHYLIRPPDVELIAKTLRAEWVQFSLNEAEDNIRFLTPISHFRQKGYETGEAFCSLGPEARTLNHWVMPPVATNPECTEWAECVSFGMRSDLNSQSRFFDVIYGTLTTIGYTFNPERGVYEWVRTGVPFQDPKRRVIEGSIIAMDQGWLIGCRTLGHPCATAWFRTSDLFSDFWKPTYVLPHNVSPRTAFLCPDGVVRIFCGDRKTSPYHTKRNPLYCWDVDPTDFSVSNQRVVMDTKEKGLGIDKPMVGFGMLFPPQGKRQILTYRVTAPKVDTHEWPGHDDGRPAITRQELTQMGNHYSEIIYDIEAPEEWDFGDTR